VQAISESVTTLQSALAGTERAVALLDEAPGARRRPASPPDLGGKES
jgi:hypothetical protein